MAAINVNRLRKDPDYWEMRGAPAWATYYCYSPGNRRVLWCDDQTYIVANRTTAVRESFKDHHGYSNYECGGEWLEEVEFICMRPGIDYWEGWQDRVPLPGTCCEVRVKEGEPWLRVRINSMDITFATAEPIEQRIEQPLLKKHLRIPSHTASYRRLRPIRTAPKGL